MPKAKTETHRLPKAYFTESNAWAAIVNSQKLNADMKIAEAHTESDWGWDFDRARIPADDRPAAEKAKSQGEKPSGKPVMSGEASVEG